MEPPAPQQLHGGICDHSYAMLESPRKLKRTLDITIDKLETCTKKLKVEQQKTRRLRKQVSDLNTVIDSLRNQHLISTNCAEMLESTFSGVPKEIFQRIIENSDSKHSNAFPEDLRSFAMTLQFYSAKAYDYVRETFDLALPHPRTIRTWYCGVEGDPGFTKQSFDALKAKANDNLAQGKETVCAVMFDEMAILKHIAYANGKYQGYVDIGTGRFDDSTPVAKDAIHSQT